MSSKLMLGSCRRVRCRPACEALTSNRIFINVGGRATVPDIPGLDQVRLSSPTVL